MQTTGIDHVNLAFPVDRLPEVIEFYVDALGFTTELEDPHTAAADDPGLFSIELGDTYRLFVNPSEDFDSDATNYRHMALRIPQPPDAIETLLDDNDISIDSTAERESDAVGAYTSYYISDPFGYTIELMATNEE